MKNTCVYCEVCRKIVKLWLLLALLRKKLRIFQLLSWMVIFTFYPQSAPTVGYFIINVPNMFLSFLSIVLFGCLCNLVYCVAFLMAFTVSNVMFHLHFSSIVKIDQNVWNMRKEALSFLYLILYLMFKLKQLSIQYLLNA